MSVTQQIIQLSISDNTSNRKYHYVPLSKELFNYTQQRSRDYDLLEGLAKSGVKSLFDGLSAIFSEKEIKKMIDKKLEEIARETDGMTFEPD